MRGWVLSWRFPIFCSSCSSGLLLAGNSGDEVLYLDLLCSSLGCRVMRLVNLLVGVMVVRANERGGEEEEELRMFACDCG